MQKKDEGRWMSNSQTDIQNLVDQIRSNIRYRQRAQYFDTVRRANNLSNATQLTNHNNSSTIGNIEYNSNEHAC